MRDTTGNLPPLPGIFPDYKAPVVANRGGIRELCLMRWGMPSSQKALLDAATKRADKLRAKGTEPDFKELLRREPDSGVTNIRNTSSKQLETMARGREPLRGAIHILQRVQQGRRRRYLVCPR